MYPSNRSPAESKSQPRSKGPRKGPKGRVPNSSKVLALGSGPLSSQTSIAEPWQPLYPTSTRRLLRYYDSFSLGAGSGVISNYIFRGNDLYDTDVTSTGHQPMGFDEMMVYYDHFVVVGSRMTVRFANLNSTSSVVYIRTDGNNAGVSDPIVLMETGGCITAQLSSNGNNGGNQTLKLNLDVLKYHGVSFSAITAMDSLQGSAGASPTDGIYFHLGCWDPNGSTSLVRIQVLIEYDAVFTEPRTPTLSRFNELRQLAETRLLRKKL